MRITAFILYFLFSSQIAHAQSATGLTGNDRTGTIRLPSISTGVLPLPPQNTKSTACSNNTLQKGGCGSKPQIKTERKETSEKVEFFDTKPSKQFSAIKSARVNESQLVLQFLSKELFEEYSAPIVDTIEKTIYEASPVCSAIVHTLTVGIFLVLKPVDSAQVAVGCTDEKIIKREVDVSKSTPTGRTLWKDFNFIHRILVSGFTNEYEYEVKPSDLSNSDGIVTINLSAAIDNSEITDVTKLVVRCLTCAPLGESERKEFSLTKVDESIYFDFRSIKLAAKTSMEERNRKIAKENEERERDAAERAPLSRQVFLAAHTEIRELLKKKDFDAAEDRHNAICPGGKFNTGECRFLWGFVFAEKASAAKGAENRTELIGYARTNLEAAFNLTDTHSDDNRDLDTLAAVILFPLISAKEEDLRLAKELLLHLKESDYSSPQQRVLATKRLAKIEATERVAELAVERAERAQKQEEERVERVREQADKLTEKREEAERQRQEKIEMARQNAEARRGDGTQDDLRCKGLGLRPATPSYIKCREAFAAKAAGERKVDDENKQRQASQEQDRRRNEESAMRGDGTPDHGTCRRYGFTPNTAAYGQCRLQLDHAKQQLERQQAEYEIRQQEYEERKTAYEDAQERRRGVMMLDASRRLLSGQGFANSFAGAAGLAPIAPQRPAIENYIITMPGGKMTNCNYVPSMRVMNCF